MEKFQAVIEFEGLAPDKQGEYLRKAGLHAEHLAAWKKSMQAALAPAGKLTDAARAERAEDRRKIKELERELHRKDRALAETTALLVLKKKADLIWGTGENE
jgi:transposase